MRVFQDAAGRSWTIALNLGSALAVKDKLGIDLLQPEQGDPPLLTRLGTDELLLGEVLCALLEGQFEIHKLSAEDVRNGFDGGTLLRAQQAFYEELVDFFQQRGRMDRAKAVTTQMKLIQAAVAAVQSQLERIDIDQAIHQIQLPTPGATSGGSPAPSA